MDPLRRCVARLVPGAVVLALMAAGCSSAPAPDETREIDVYEAILRWIIDHTEAEVTTDDETRTVFVDNLGPEQISLDTQVELVVRLADEATLRFVDELEEAIDVDLDGRPVRDGAVLIGLGLMPEETPIEVRGELYLDADDVRGWRFPMILRSGQWELRSQPEVVDPEGLVETP